MIQLILQNYGNLDLNGKDPIPLNWNLNDIREVSNRGGIWSKTITLYGTNNNNSILATVFDVNIEYQTFNPLRKEKCRLLVDGLLIFEGTFQLRKIKKRYSEQNVIIMYECLMKSDNSDFFTFIDGKYLTDLDLSRYNHIHSLENIEASMQTGIWTTGYQYWLGVTPITEWPAGSNTLLNIYESRDLKPAVYVKTILDQMFLESGYTYTFDELYFLDIDKLIIPFSGENIEPGLQQPRFRVGIGTETSLLMTLFDENGFHEDDLNVSPSSQNDAESLNPGIFDEGDTVVIFDGTNLNDQLYNLFDPNNNYNEINGAFTLDPSVTSMFFETEFISWNYIKIVNGGFGEIPGASASLIVSTDNIDTIHTGNALDTLVKQNIYTYLFAYDITDQPLFPPISQTYNGTIEYDVNQKWDLNIETFTSEILCSTNGTFNRDFYPTAAYIKVVVLSSFIVEGSNPQSLNPQSKVLYPYYYNSSPGANLCNAEYYLKPQFTTPIIGYFQNSPGEDIVDNSLVLMNNILPKDVKQSEFLNAIVKMFNLYLYSDKTDNNNIIIKTRDQFYLDGRELNWTNKVDRNSIDIDFISNTQDKVKLFTYKDDDDDLLKNYSESVKEIFGQHKYIFRNEFIKGESSVEPIFSPTAMIPQYNKNVPYINARAPKNNLRILSVGDIFNSGTYWHWRLVNSGLVIETSPKNFYRHVGHLYPNSFNPSKDFNYGICDFYAHTYNTVTDNNLFNRFWRNQFDILENGYMMIAYFKLNYLDIANIEMCERIYVNDSWWNINRIIDYNINGNALTQVELITADAKIGQFISNNNVFVQKKILDGIDGFGNITFNGYGSDSNSSIQGSYNRLSGSNNVVIGDFNNVKNNNGLVVGSGNVVFGTGIIALGVNNKRLDEPGTVYLGKTSQVVDIIDAGRNEVIGLFPDVIVNIVDGGRDVIRPIGTFAIPFIIDAGRDRV